MAQDGQEQTVRLASIVAVDMVRFSAMSERDQRRAARAVEALRTRIQTIAEANGGRIFNSAGDGFMLEFGSARAALGFIQAMIDRRPRGQPAIRLGAHVGDVVVTTADDLLGHGVNIAARLQALAAPNTALVSGEFRSMARSSPTVAFQARGRQPLENIDQKVQTYAILSSGQRFGRAVARAAALAASVAALALLAFFGGHVEQAAEDSGALRALGLARPAAQAAATAAAPGPPSPVAAPAAAVAPARQPGDVFRDCAQCPEMAVVPAGVFMMGAAPDEQPRFANEEPRHEVAVRSLAVGRYEVTFAEWDACLAASACAGYSPPDRGWGRGRRPVVGVSWNDAQAYVDWLNQAVGKPVYRLLSEAEWEYVARAGSTGAYGATLEMTRDVANFGARRADPVGSYEANGFGLHDLAGNAGEWVADCYARSYAGAPADGGAVAAPSCAYRVYRGGSYADPVAALRVANRRRAAAGLRDAAIGFRVARELDEQPPRP